MELLSTYVNHAEAKEHGKRNPRARREALLKLETNLRNYSYYFKESLRFQVSAPQTK
jgi:hypothetical protein